MNDNKNDTEMPVPVPCTKKVPFKTILKKWDRKQTKDLFGIKTPFNILSYFKS